MPITTCEFQCKLQSLRIEIGIGKDELTRKEIYHLDGMKSKLWNVVLKDLQIGNFLKHGTREFQISKSKTLIGPLRSFLLQ